MQYATGSHSVPGRFGLGYGKPATTKIKVLAHGTRQALNDRGYVVGMEW